MGRVSVPRPDASSIPDAPGAYLFRDDDGRVVYVGKARSLRKRLANYWGRDLHPRTEAMVAAAASVEWIMASTEVDALLLEYNLIQEHRPSLQRPLPRRQVLSLPRADGGGALAPCPGPAGRQAQERPVLRPFGHAYAIRETLDALTRVFPVRTCSNSFFDQRARARRPCLYYDIGRCSGPCVPEQTGVTEESYRADVEALGEFLSGHERPIMERLEREMEEAARRQEYELAAKHRDQLTAARRALESQEMVLSHPEDLDVVGLAEDDLEAGFQVFFVRRGRVMGRKGWVVDRVEDLDRPGLVASFLRELYMQRQDVPPRILVPELPSDADVLGEWLSSRREGPVRFAVPERGTKRKLMETVTQNATDQFRRHKLRRASDFGARSRALAELGRRLELEQPPLRIECYDISNLGPTDTVGSMVVFEDGLPKRSDYRRFEIKGVPGQDDFASMEEMLRRRLARLAKDREPGERRRFAYPPALIVVDGGRGQLSSATKALADADVHIPAIGLAKRLEEVYFPDRPDPLVIPRGSEALFVLQHLRDEAHRFAVTYHREKRGKRALASPLDDVTGVGPSRKKALLKRFGSWPASRGRARTRSPRRRGSGRTSPERSTIGSRVASRPGEAERVTADPERTAGHPKPSEVPSKGSAEEPSKLSDRRTRAAKRAAVPAPRTRGSRSSPASPAPAARRRRGASRTSATSWWTTSRPRCCRRWPSSGRGPADPAGWRSCSTSAAACTSASSPRRSRSSRS
jgi:excinuclease ABC subunit C